MRQRQPRVHDEAHLDFIGRRFGRLQVVAYIGPIANTTLWRVRCDCGTEKQVRRGNLLTVKSCGCLRREGQSVRASTHGLTRVGKHHPLYSIWDGMKRRCHGKTPSPRYGGRGITVCDRWLSGDEHKTGFECFLEDMGPRPTILHSLDRVDYNGNYTPENCRWATALEQQRNRSSNRMVRFRGRGMTLTEAIELSGLKEGTVWGRLHMGWTIERALTVPPIVRGK